MSIGPRRLNRYELQTRLGRGGMAEVWKAFDPQLQRHVAIKILHADLQNDPSFISRFEREAQLIASLHHPNIVQIYDFHVSHPPETDETIAYMVMDYVEGTTLSHYLRSTSHEGNFLSPIDIISIFTPICRAVDYAHKKGMLHRDLKPANILLDKRNPQLKIGEPILSDFGIAKLLESANIAHSAWWLGTPHYMSPEQAQGNLGNERSDIYALAVILYEICAGTLPFQGDHPTTIMMQHIHADPIPPLLINPAIQPALAAVILRGLAKSPNDRFPDASIMCIAVAEALSIKPPLQSTSQSDAFYTSNVTNPPRTDITPKPSSWAAVPQQLSPGTDISTPLSASSSNQAALYNTLTNNRNSDANRISIPYSPLPVGPADSEPHTNTSDEEAAAPLASLRPISVPSSPVLTQNIPHKPASLKPPKRTNKRHAIFSIFIAFILMVCSLSALFLLARQNAQPATNLVVGNVFFLNSGLLNADNSQGLNDEILLDLHNIPNPPSGKTYYGWLLSDTGESEPATTALGHLSVAAGNIHFLYKGTPQHTNLLTIRSRILITQEDASIQPDSYSPNYTNWIYYGLLPQNAGPNDKLHFSMLDHLRHLLSETPELSLRGLHGGLDVWFLRNTEQVLTLTNSARDNWKDHPDQFRAQLTAILDYIDGKDSVQQDIPPSLPSMAVSPFYVQVPLVGPAPDGQDPPGYSFKNESPPGYVYLISSHLSGTVLEPDATADQRDLADRIHVAIDQTQGWLTQVRQDAKQLLAMSNAQQAQPQAFALLDDMLLNAQYAYSGQADPLSGQTAGGATWICSNIQRMASIEVKPFDQKTYTP
jgi:serine/threonine protein kinase